MLAGTIVASNYVAMAQVLARSYLAAHSDGRFVILVVDDGEASVDDERVDVWRLDALGLDPTELDVMLTIYDVREFATAVKPAFLRTLLDRDELACYVDPDIRVYAPFGDVVAPAVDHDILLTPHVLHPVPRDGLDVSEETLRLAGMFNLGFLAVGTGAVPFLDWWAERLLTDAVIDLPRGLFTDQRWVDWVPALFRHVVCRDPGMNIAWWNAHERPIELLTHDGAQRPHVDGHPVRFVHFSGYDPFRPDVLSHWQPHPRQSWAPDDPLRVLAEEYGRELVDAGHFERRA
ncbi:MAG: FkbM family methyltransferase, partial [Acidimicrobiia bacterium]